MINFVVVLRTNRFRCKLSVGSVLGRLVLLNVAKRTIQSLKRPSGARVMTCSQSLGRSVIDRSLDRSLDQSLDRWLARSLVRSLARSLDRSLDRSVTKRRALTGKTTLQSGRWEHICSRDRLP